MMTYLQNATLQVKEDEAPTKEDVKFNSSRDSFCHMMATLLILEL